MPAAHDLSLLGLFLRADLVVKGVMLLLVLLSVLVWAVAIDRSVRLRRLTAEAMRLDGHARGGPVPSGPGLAGAVLDAGRDAAAETYNDETRGERRERVRDAMRLALGDGLSAVQPGLPLLATVGSAAPFIGLFGTVWGIMDSFTAIAASGDTSLSTVAPGIAEALFATAIGLAAAIPAVLLYNRLTTQLSRARALATGAVARLAAPMAAEG